MTPDSGCHDILLQPCVESPERLRKLLALHSEGALVMAAMAEACLSLDPRRMFESTFRLRRFLTDTVHPFFSVRDDDFCWK
jgi:hypothetical protein